MIKASLISIGAYAPSGVLTNLDLEKMVDTKFNQWTRQLNYAIKRL